MHCWSLHKRRDTDTSYYTVIAMKLIEEEGDRTTSRLSDSNQGRHALTLTRQGMQFINVHAESGGSQDSRDARASQLQYLARAHESTARDACVLAGDFNLRQGEDRVLLEEGWHDAACKVIDVGSEGGDAWTWGIWHVSCTIRPRVHSRRCPRKLGVCALFYSARIHGSSPE